MSRSGALILGPALTGLLIQLVTAPISIIVDALSFLGSAFFVTQIPVQENMSAHSERTTNIWSEMREGIRLVFTNPFLRTLASSLAVYNFFSNMIATLYILYFTHILGFTPFLLGLVYSIGCIGFPLGAFLAQPAAKRWGSGPTIVWGDMHQWCRLSAYSTCQQVAYLTIPLLIAAQFIATSTGPITAINQLSFRQSITPDHLQGRINGTMHFVMYCAAPAGAFIAGILGQIISIRATILIGAIGMQFGFLVLLFSPLRKMRKTPEMTGSPSFRGKDEVCSYRSS